LIAEICFSESSTMSEGSAFSSTLADAGSPANFGWPPTSPVKYAAAVRIHALAATTALTRPALFFNRMNVPS
jgi:hypothetical protein